MPFDLSTSPEFFFAPGEPEDSGPAENDRGQPVSVYSAISKEIEGMCPEAVAELAQLVDSDPRASDFAWKLTQLARETNTSSNLDSPVEVWIDREGDFRVFVYDNNR